MAELKPEPITPEDWERLLKIIASPGICKGCQAPIFWIRTAKKDRWVPINTKGRPHWADCPKAEQF